MSSDICQTCRKPHPWPDGTVPVHPFNTGESGATAFLGKRGHRAPTPDRNASQRGTQTPPRVIFPTDPALRVALINAGVITGEQIQAAEDMLRLAMGGQLDGQSTAGTRGREVQVGETAPVDVG